MVPAARLVKFIHTILGQVDEITDRRDLVLRIIQGSISGTIVHDHVEPHTAILVKIMEELPHRHNMLWELRLVGEDWQDRTQDINGIAREVEGDVSDFCI